MVFNKNDIYTSSGSTRLYNSWTPYVSKYDTSSFYNWEQDNLPLYDLEERTYEMWEQGGFPTSAVPGLALVVSADAPQASLLANTNIFTTVSACIAAIPKIVRFPVFIEVCNLGDLGKLELHNFRIEEGGSIEIINRAYSRIYNASANSYTTVIPTDNESHRITAGLKSLNVSSTLFAALGADLCTSSLILSSRVLESEEDARVDSVYTYMYPNFTKRRSPLAVCIDGDPFLEGGGGQNRYPTTPYENATTTAAFDGTLGSLDMSATSQMTNNPIGRTGWNANISGTGSVYLNNLAGLSVKNCDGPIYIRNFNVDGKSTTTGGIQVGIEVTNSDVLLENCAAARCREAGFRFNNSKVTLSRSAFAYRNYDLNSLTTRVPEKGIGFHALNSEITFSSLLTATTETGAGDFEASGADVAWVASRNYVGIQLDNSKVKGGISRTTRTSPGTASFVESELNTGYGLVFNNSHMDVNGLLDIYGNEAGILMNNSHLRYNELCVDSHRDEGLNAKNSTIIFDSSANPLAAGQLTRYQVDFIRNSQHLLLDNNSSFGFKLKTDMPSKYGNMSFSGAQGAVSGSPTYTPVLPAIAINNNSNAEFINTRFIPRVAGDSVANMPVFGLGLQAVNNSKASFYGTEAGCTLVFGIPTYTFQQKVAGLYADKNSEINLHGPTVIAQFGVDVLVENDSSLTISPPTSRKGHGYDVSSFALSGQGNNTSVELHATRACLVANKNSVINMQDLGDYHTFWGRGANGTILLAAGTDYPTETFDLSSYIASGSLQFYPNPQDSLTLKPDVGITPTTIPVFTETFNLNTYLINDNPLQGAADYAEATGRPSISIGGVCVRAVQDSVVNIRNVHFPTGNQSNPLDGYIYKSNGTNCDRLMIWNIADTSRLNASYCSVSGLYPGDAGYHGPSALWPSSVDGNILNAGQQYDVIASGAPSATPDTGYLSVLDTFGAGSSVWLPPSGVSLGSMFDRFYPISGHGQEHLDENIILRLVDAGINFSGTTTYHYGAPINTYNNQGVFRIFWSPKSSAKLLQSDVSGYVEGKFPHPGVFSGVVGPTYQIFSQGYNMSAPVSAVLQTDGANVSSLHPDLLKLSYDYRADAVATGNDVPDRLWTSGFYYCKEFVEDNPTQCMLDESAADTFANSKNASLGSSGRPKKVTLYRSRLDSIDNRGAEAYAGDTSGTHGFKSANIFDLERDN